MARRALPALPEHVPAGAAPIWDRIVAELTERGMKDTDLDLVTILVTAMWRHRQAGEQIHELLMSDDDGLPVVNPLLRVERDQAATIMRVATELGLTPAARLRLGLMQLAGQSILAGLNTDLDRRIGGAG